MGQRGEVGEQGREGESRRTPPPAPFLGNRRGRVAPASGRASLPLSHMACNRNPQRQDKYARCSLALRQPAGCSDARALSTRRAGYGVGAAPRTNPAD